jgi:hypothetical protein
MLTTVLLIVAAVLFAIAAISPKSTPVHLGWAGALFLALAFALQGA